MFYISGFHKAKSLYCNGSKIFWYSKKRAQIKNVSWTRGGTNYAYSVTKRSKKNPRASLQFQICFPYADDEVCLCYAIPYTYSDLLKSIDHWDNIAKPGVFKHETLCSTDGGRDCPILTITSPNNTIPLEKRKYIFITGRIHPGESNSSFLVHGLIDFLLSDTPEANYIIESTIIKCVPMMNIDGVVEGFYRVSLSGNDLNRMWTAPDLILHPVVYHTKSLIRKIVSEKGCTFYIDFHGHSRLHGTFIYGCPNDDDHEFRNSEKIYPGILSLLSDTFSLSHCVFSFPQERKSAGRIVVRTEFNILNSYTVETSFGGVFAGGCANCLYDETLWKEIGEKCGLAIYHYLLDDNSQYTKYAKKKVELLAPKTLPVSQNQEKEKIQIDMTNKSDCFGKRKFTEDDISSVSLGVKQPKWERISFKLEK
ncbi:Clan MC, family M14, Zinc carboxypeptidase-like metallopeptidase [Histomonas meleagridis]|uniref:Clan MC, family M14, Zinc carboxypeptidase-like metallopeptidase n=1 Tax=Histomonas meleagridis TaxID=135588 RepID=UPI003559E970|nr:Clan MC, family M14, Zinc carboxypeptidase-like metallopeptidase [Histomonas meleagridis]KAH0803106.1 Clan MC, family M14, Zinc carboxypeptidase-like metallopeptidase [Histomonas meleagridis]